MNRLDARRRAIAAAYLPLARHLALRFKSKAPWRWEEFDSAALWGLVKAAATFDFDRGVKFATFARRHILGELSDESARLNRLQGLTRPLALTRRSAPDADAIDELESFESLLRRLPTQHATILRLIYRDSHSQREVAAVIRKAPSYVCRLHREGLGLLSESLRSQTKS